MLAIVRGADHHSDRRGDPPLESNPLAKVVEVSLVRFPGSSQIGCETHLFPCTVSGTTNTHSETLVLGWNREKDDLEYLEAPLT